MSQAPSKDKTLVYCQKAKHDLAHEEEIGEVMERVVR